MNTFGSTIIFVLSVTSAFAVPPCTNNVRGSEWTVSETNPSAKASSNSVLPSLPAKSIPYLGSLSSFSSLQNTGWTLSNAPVAAAGGVVKLPVASASIQSLPTALPAPLPAALPASLPVSLPASLSALLPCNTPKVSAIALPVSQSDQKGETYIHRPAPIIVKRPPTKIQINHPPLVVKPAPVVFHKPPAKVVRPTVVKNLPPSVQIEPVFMKVLNPPAKKVLVSEPPCETAGINVPLKK